MGRTGLLQIYYFVGESSHPKVRDMWVLEKLVEKDAAAQKGVGDPAVFLGVGDADLEEEIVACAVSAGISELRPSELRWIAAQPRFAKNPCVGRAEADDLVSADFVAQG